MSVDAVGRLPLKIVVPLTDWKAAFSAFPWMVLILATPQNGLHKQSGADAFQAKSISEARFVRRIGVITSGEADDIAEAIALCVGTP